MQTNLNNSDDDGLGIAVVGMSSRFPGAKNTEEFWGNLANGIESVHFFSDEELINEGIDPKVLKDPNYIKAAPILDDVDTFDASFFNFSPGEADILDPQRRLFLECGWEAFEDSGYDPAVYDGAIGVYAGAGLNLYMINNLLGNSEVLRTAGDQQFLISSDKDHLPTHLSYKLNLKGPSVNVNTACSSSLVAIHMARQSLLLGECDMAVAGGSAIIFPHKSGYYHIEDSILSSTGHCKAFDSNSDGTLWGSGCGVVILKRLEDAIADKDNIYAVIRGSAINNDGSSKVSFTAPSVEGQIDVVMQALANAGIDASDISYIEAHGTGTKLGDPIEVAALTEAFRADTDEKGICALGSVKTNIGHLGAASGVAGFIKTVLSIKNAKIPPSLNYEAPNPKINFEDSPFYVNTKLSDWKPVSGKRRAGVSSVAVGGTNAHVIIEESPQYVNNDLSGSQDDVILVLSARTPTALENAADRLAEYLEKNKDISLNDVAFTLQCGRRAFQYRRAFITKSIDDAIQVLKTRNSERILDSEMLKNGYEYSGSGTVLENKMILWLKEGQVEWKDLYKIQPRRVSLPTYPFERRKYWVNPITSKQDIKQDSLDAKISNLADWFYEFSWKRKSLPKLKEIHHKDGMVGLVFADSCEIGVQIAEQLKEIGEKIIIVTKGEDFKKISDWSYSINPTKREDYELLISELKTSDKIPNEILHLFSITEADQNDEEISLESFEKYQSTGFFSILYLMQALSKEKVNSAIQLKVFSNDMHDIIGNEKTRPEKTSIIGQCKVIQQEFPNITCSSVDIVLSEDKTVDSKFIDNLVKEVCIDTDDIVIAYRNGTRWVQTYEHIQVEKNDERKEAFKEGGVYLFYDPLVSTALELAKYAMREKGAKVLFIADNKMPLESEWDMLLKESDPREDISVKIHGARELIRLGGQYLGRMPDINDKEKIEELISDAEKCFGSINGVIHGAGATVDGHLVAINDATYDIVRRNFNSIPYALYALDQVFEKRQVDFKILMGSLGTVLGGMLFIAFGSGSMLGVSYASKRNKILKTPWNIVGWDSWVVEWEANDYKNNVLDSKIIEKVKSTCIGLDEGLECFERIFDLNLKHQIVVSSTDLNVRYNKWIKKKNESEKEKSNNLLLRHPRPELETICVMPRTPLEESLSEIYGELLNIDKIGIYDNFFELGGHSLLCTQLILKIRESLDIDLPINAVIENPTVESIASLINN